MVPGTTDGTATVGAGGSGEGSGGALAAAQAGASGTAAAAAAASLADDAQIEYKVDGQTYRKTWGEVIRTQAMLPGKFTQEMQELAKRRTAFEAERAGVETQAASVRKAQEAMQAIVSDPARLAALYMAVQANRSGQSGQGGPPQPQFDPNAVRQQILAEANASVESRMTAFRNEQAAANLERELGTFTGGLLAGKPELTAIRGIEDLVYGQVAQMGPQSVAQAKEYTKHVIEEYAKTIGQIVTDSSKRNAESKRKVITGIEPKGGAAQAPQARKYGGLDDPNREKDMLAYLEAMLNDE